MTYEQIEQKLTDQYRQRKHELIQAEVKQQSFQISMWSDRINQLKGELTGLTWAKALISEARASQELLLRSQG